MPHKCSTRAHLDKEESTLCVTREDLGICAIIPAADANQLEAKKWIIEHINFLIFYRLHLKEIAINTLSYWSCLKFSWVYNLDRPSGTVPHCINILFHFFQFSKHLNQQHYHKRNVFLIHIKSIIIFSAVTQKFMLRRKTTFHATWNTFKQKYSSYINTSKCSLHTHRTYLNNTYINRYINAN